MIIAETLSFQVGCYTVQQRPRPDNPGWPVYIIYIGVKLIGKSFSLPNLDCCESLAKQSVCDRHVYARPDETARIQPFSMGAPIKRGVHGTMQNGTMQTRRKRSGQR